VFNGFASVDLESRDSVQALVDTSPPSLPSGFYGRRERSVVADFMGMTRWSGIQTVAAVAVVCLLGGVRSLEKQVGNPIIIPHDKWDMAGAIRVHTY